MTWQEFERRFADLMRAMPEVRDPGGNPDPREVEKTMRKAIDTQVAVETLGMKAFGAAVMRILDIDPKKKP